MRFDKKSYATLILIIIHLVGIIGLSIPNFQSLFLSLTPLNLLISTIILFSFHKNRNSWFYIFIFSVFIISFSLEALGTATGIIFGNYTYTSVLGPRFFNTPLIIGVNWVLLIYTAGTVVDPLKAGLLVKSILASGLLVLYDFALEPVAIELKFWIWENDRVPLQNFIAWFFVSFMLLLLFYKLPIARKNPMALKLFLIHLIFFAVLSFTLRQDALLLQLNKEIFNFSYYTIFWVT